MQGFSSYSIVLIVLYFIPTIVAIRKQHPQKIAIILVNLIGGLFYGVGWIVALVWCFIQAKQSDVADEIAKLNLLKENGILTEVEFETKKEALIKML